MSILLTDEEIRDKGLLVFITSDYECRDIAKAQLKKVASLPVGEFCIVNKEFVDGKPNCLIITMVDWQALLKEAGLK